MSTFTLIAYPETDKQHALLDYLDNTETLDMKDEDKRSYSRLVVAAEAVGITPEELAEMFEIGFIEIE